MSTAVGFDYSKLKGRIIEKYGTQGRFAEALGVSMNAVSKKLNARTSFNKKEILVWAALLDIKQDEIGVYFFA